jgi:hypothetical protein
VVYEMEKNKILVLIYFGRKKANGDEEDHN